MLQKTISQEGVLSESSWGLFPKGKERTRIRRSSFWGGGELQKKKHVIKHHKILLVTHTQKDQTFQVNDFSAILFMGRCKSMGSVKLFLFVHTNTLEPVSSFFPILNSTQSTALGAAAVTDDFVKSSIHCLPEWQATVFSPHHRVPSRVTLSCCGLHLRIPRVEHHQDSCLYFLSPGLTLMKISASRCAGPRMLQQELRPFLSPREKVELLPSLQSFKCSKIFLGQPIHTELESVARRG